MTDKHIEALKLALEALENAQANVGEWWPEAITALREALTDIGNPISEQPAQQQEPVAWMYQCSADSSGPVLMQHKRDWAESGSGLWTETPLYTSPQPSKPWVGLTESEKSAALYDKDGMTLDYDDYAEAIEAKLREKNA